MNQEPTPPARELTTEELRHLLRDGGPPLTRREIRERQRAEAAGLLTRVEGKLVLAQEPPAITSADVLAGKVPAASGLTRRQLRELAAQHANSGEEPPEEGREQRPEEPREQQPAAVDTPPVAPRRVSARAVTRRPVIRPEGAHTGEYTGEFDQIRQAAAEITAAPGTPHQTPQRRSVFDAQVPAGLSETPVPEERVEETDAADWSSAVSSAVVTDDVLPALDPAPDEEPAPAEPHEEAAESERGDPGAAGDDASDDGEEAALPDWHTLTTMPSLPPEDGDDLIETVQAATKRRSSPVWLTVLQWLVIVVVAVVLGLLVWFAINRGFGSEGAAAAGIIHPRFYLPT